MDSEEFHKPSLGEIIGRIEVIAARAVVDGIQSEFWVCDECLEPFYTLSPLHLLTIGGVENLPVSIRRTDGTPTDPTRSSFEINPKIKKALRERYGFGSVCPKCGHPSERPVFVVRSIPASNAPGDFKRCAKKMEGDLFKR